jgi:SAM-dependent methyltransferase
MRPATHLLLALNRLFPRPRFPDRPTPESYAEWEYGEAPYQIGLMKAAGVTLAGARVLDLGCGLGGKTARFSELGPESVLGLDRSRENARAGRDFARKRGLGRGPGAKRVRETAGIEFVAADAAHIPVRGAVFDLVLTTDTFEHFPEPERTLAEIRRVLRPGGRLVAVFGPFGSPLGSHLYDTIFVPWCHLLFSRDTLAEAVREIARREAVGSEPARAEQGRLRAEEQIDYFDHHLNRMTLGRFRRLLASERGLALRNWTTWTPPKLRPLSPLLRVPGLDEVLTGLLVAVAERV